MPAKQMIVEFAHLAGCVVVSDRVKIGDGQGSMGKRERDQRDQPARPDPVLRRPTQNRHVFNPPSGVELDPFIIDAVRAAVKRGDDLFR